MNDLDRVPINGGRVPCERCLTESDKSETILRMLVQAPQSASVLVVRCVGCATEIVLMISSPDTIQAIKNDPYQDVRPSRVDTQRIQSAPDAIDESDAFSHYEAGAKAFEKGECEQAYALWRSAFQWYAASPDAKVIAPSLLANMGMALSGLGDPEGALQCFHDALCKMNPSDDSNAYATVLNNIGASYLHLGQMAQAEDWHRQAYECHLQHADTSNPILAERERDNLAFTYARLAKSHATGGNLGEAVRYARKAHDLYPGELASSQGKVFYIILGNLLCRHAEMIRSADANMAVSTLMKAILAYEDCKAGPELLVTAYRAIADVQRKAGRIEDAMATLQRVDDLLQAVSNQRPPLTVFRKRAWLESTFIRLTYPLRRFRAWFSVTLFRKRQAADFTASHNDNQRGPQ